MRRATRVQIMSGTVLAVAVLSASQPVRAARGYTGGPMVIWSASTTRPVVALTFDDGPSPFTVGVLSILRTFHAHATFFLVGRRVRAYPAIVRAEIGAGNDVGNHTYSHADLLWMYTPYVLAQLAMTQEAVKASAGVVPHWFRPPYGALSPRVTDLAASLGLRTVLWSVDPADWARPGAGAIAVRVLTRVRPGSIVLMHDGGGDRGETVAALPAILRALQLRGYRFLTLDELFDVSPHPPSPAGSSGNGGRRK